MSAIKTSADSDEELISLQCDNDDTRFFIASKRALSQYINYFEGNTSTRGLTYDSRYISFDALQKLVEFMESGELRPPLDDMREMLIVAEFINMRNPLITLFKSLPDNMIGHVLGMDDKIRELEEDSLYELLLAEDLLMCEVDVLRTIKMWVNYDVKARKGSFCKLLKCLRPDKAFTTQFILDEFTCHCGPHCQCLITRAAQEFVVNFLVHGKKVSKSQRLNGLEIRTSRRRLPYERIMIPFLRRGNGNLNYSQQG